MTKFKIIKAPAALAEIELNDITAKLNCEPTIHSITSDANGHLIILLGLPANPAPAEETISLSLNYEIWYADKNHTKNSRVAVFIGTSTGTSFEDACINYANHNASFYMNFNPENLTYLDCVLVPSKAAAINYGLNNY